MDEVAELLGVCELVDVDVRDLDSYIMSSSMVDEIENNNEPSIQNLHAAIQVLIGIIESEESAIDGLCLKNIAAKLISFVRTSKDVKVLSCKAMEMTLYLLQLQGASAFGVTPSLVFEELNQFLSKIHYSTVCFYKTTSKHAKKDSKEQAYSQDDEEWEEEASSQSISAVAVAPEALLGLLMVVHQYISLGYAIQYIYKTVFT
jgi:hypothetical protein